MTALLCENIFYLFDNYGVSRINKKTNLFVLFLILRKKLS